MGKRTSKNTTVTENTFAPWAQDFAQSNLGYADALTSGVMNRYAGGPNAVPGAPTSYIPAFSDDTESAFQMARNFATGSTPTDMRGIAGDVGGYRDSVARNLNARAPLNRAVNDAVRTLGSVADTTAPQFTGYNPLNAQTVNTQSYQAAQLGAVPGFEATQVGSVSDIAARQGASLMNAYMNPYLQQVVDTSLSDFDVGVDRQANQNRARRDAASAFGDRAALADAVYAADSNRGRGSLSSGLRSDAFNTSAGFGMQDANRFLEADRSNQQVALQRAMENARLQQAAAQANAQMEYNRREFNTQLDQNTRKDNATFSKDANFKNTDIGNTFLQVNDDRMRNLEMQNFNAGVANNTQRAAAAEAQAALAMEQQLNQLKLAQGLTGIAGDQTGLLNQADAAEQRRIAAQTAVGQAIDERNQAVLREPLDLLEWRAKMLEQTPYPKTTTVNTTQKMSGIDALKGYGDIFGNYSKLLGFKTPEKPFKFF